MILVCLLAPRRALTAFLRGCEEQLAPGLFLAAADTARVAAAGCAADGAATAPLTTRASGGSQGGAAAAAVHAVREALDRGEQVIPMAMKTSSGPPCALDPRSACTHCDIPAHLPAARRRSCTAGV